MDPPTPSLINDRIAERVRTLRTRFGWSLESLAAACGVSRSALSLIERAESSPTAVVLDKIATGLGVPLGALLGNAPDERASLPLTRRAEQSVWRDPSSGYLRRSVSPGGDLSPIQIVEVTFPAGARVAFETGQRDRVIHQQLWLLEGMIDFSIGSDTYRLQAGDCLASVLDRPTMFHNPTDENAHYAVVVVAEPIARR